MTQRKKTFIMFSLFTSDFLTLIPAVVLIGVSGYLLTGKNKVINIIKSFKVFLFLLVVLSLTSCGKHEAYSPLYSYIKATNESYYSNVKANTEAKQFIDSLNNSHK